MWRRCPPSPRAARPASPEPRRCLRTAGTGSLEDVEHVVVLIQENRSFDHYFGTLRGVRGYGDPHPAVLPSGKPVWHQSDGSEGRAALPTGHGRPRAWRSSRTSTTGGTAGTRRSTAAGTTSGCRPRRRRRWRTWPGGTSRSTTRWPTRSRSATPTTARCSGPTDPNRYYAWTGWVGNDGKGGGPVIANDELGYSWTTYPERLQKAGVELEDLPGRRDRSGRRRVRGAGAPTIPTSATTATTRCCTSTSTAAPSPATRSTTAPGPAPTCRRAARSSTSCAPT